MNYISHKSPTVMPPRLEPTMPPISSMNEDVLREAMMRDGAAKRRFGIDAGKSNSAGARPGIGRHTGVLARILDVLKDGKPRTSAEIAAKLGDIPRGKIGSRLSTTADTTGIVERVGYVNQDGRRLVVWRFAG